MKNIFQNKSDIKPFLPSWLGLTGILCLTVLLYLNGLDGEILRFDDREYFSNYPEITNLTWQSVVNFFSNYYVIMYQPIPILLFALNYHFTGLNIFFLHLTNLVFHLLNTTLVFSLIQSITKSRLAALVMALFFAIHPMNVEAVTWLSARSSVIYVFWALLALKYYMRYVQHGFQIRTLAVVMIFFIGSLLSKAQAVALPAVMLLIDFYVGRKLLSIPTIIEKIPFFAIGLLFGWIAMGDHDTRVNMSFGMANTYEGWEKLLLLTYSVAFYLFKMFLPLNLCSIYSFPIKIGGLFPLEYYLSVAFCAFFGIFVYMLRKDRLAMFGVGIFFAVIVLNLQLFSSRLFIVADRYLYFPSIGLMLLTYAFIRKFTGIERRIVTISLISSFVFFSFSTHARNRVWKNDESLMTDIISKNPPVPYIARAYLNRGQSYMDSGRVADAIADFKAAIAIDPGEPLSHSNLGSVLAEQGRVDEAIYHFQSALRIQPSFAEVHYNLGLALVAKGKQEEALPHFEEAVRFKPDFAPAKEILGRLR